MQLQWTVKALLQMMAAQHDLVLRCMLGGGRALWPISMNMVLKTGLAVMVTPLWLMRAARMATPPWLMRVIETGTRPLRPVAATILQQQCRKLLAAQPLQSFTKQQPGILVPLCPPTLPPLLHGQEPQTDLLLQTSSEP